MLVMLLARVAYRRFEELPVWREAAELARIILEFTGDKLFRQHHGLCDQLERAALSISNTIAAGFERGSNNELLAYLYIARGSAGELRSMLHVLESWAVFTRHKDGIIDLTAPSENIPRQLYRWIERVKRSGLRGQRHLNVGTATPLAYADPSDRGEASTRNRRR